MAAFFDWFFTLLASIGCIGYLVSFFKSKNFSFFQKYRIVSLFLFLAGMFFIIISIMHAASWKDISYEFENIENYQDRAISRSNASNYSVIGPFGSETNSPYSEKADTLSINKVCLPRGSSLLLKLQYSKNSPEDEYAPIKIFFNNESKPRAEFVPQNTRDWNNFASDSLGLGKTYMGRYHIKFITKGQRFGTVNLDKVTIYDSECSKEPLYNRMVCKAMNLPLIAVIIFIFGIVKGLHEAIKIIKNYSRNRNERNDDI